MESKFTKALKNLGKYVLRIFGLFLIIVFIQVITFSIYGVKRLEKKFLPSYFMLTSKTDSIYVRGYPIMDDNVSKISFITFDLKSIHDKIKQSFNVKHIFFQERSNATNEKVENQYNLLYYVWAEKRNWWPISDFHKVRLIEYLNNRNQELLKEVDYQWILFFWFKRTELIQSWEISHDGHKTIR
jgi:hypothetical protein